ncbi:aminotransferase class V-fold PLP-dependent enzyme [Cytobacillus horneckiae]|uniref:aminotransferase class V-fold PLP-dependent enzyme n=1 Tax=Cytobacillus horneckiae TaxID=549687 RepID=UPI003D9A0E8C
MMEFIYKIASDQEEYDQIYQLNYKTFVEEIPQHGQNERQLLIDRFDGENTYIIAKWRNEVVGMIAVRAKRPFSLDQKIENLDEILPTDARPCEIRLLSVKESFRMSPVFFRLCELLVSYCLEHNYNMALISGVDKQIPLYKKIGFIPFGEIVASGQARFQPMYLTKEQFESSTKVFKRMLARFSKPKKPISFLPGPVQMHPAVQEALAFSSISHRDQIFTKEFKEVQNRLSHLTGAKFTDLAVGTGTLANDIVAAQLQSLRGKGLILAAGEFGYRLINHADRFHLNYLTIEKQWNEPINLIEIRQVLMDNPDITWLWTVHCETSTGYVFDLPAIEQLCSTAGVELCVDACSSVGIIPVSFQNLLFATSVSGKGLGSYPGLAIIFHREPIISNPDIPRYLDLGLYHNTDSVPFTHSSNLIKALRVAMDNMNLLNIENNAAAIRRFLEKESYPFAGDDSYSPGIITIQLPANLSSKELGDYLKQKHIYTSYESQYLVDRNWLQISLMGHHSEDELQILQTELAYAKEAFSVNSRAL